MLSSTTSAQNIQILVETMLRCGGNCSGCALSSTERMSKSSMDWVFFEEKTAAVHQYLQQRQTQEEIESVSIFLGQGDHFLMPQEEMSKFMQLCAQMIPQELKHKTVVLITASAIGKPQQVREKMDRFFALSLSHGLPFFIQVVFDPKKMKVSEKFKQQYMDNILYFKNKCGMTELTINLGKDLLEHMTPVEFHQWVMEYGFSHVEMNWVMNGQTQEMWQQHSQGMFNWLKELLQLNAQEHFYEINFIPFLARALNWNAAALPLLREKMASSLARNLYIDNVGNVSLAQAGLVSNLLALDERLKSHTLSIGNMQDLDVYAKQEATRIISTVLKKPACMDCEFKQVCMQIGSCAWMRFTNHNALQCPWNIKDFLEFVHSYLDRYPLLRNTQFNKNPVQDVALQKENNATFGYFEEKFFPPREGQPMTAAQSPVEIS